MIKRKKRVLLIHSLPARDNAADPDFRIAPVGLFFISGALKRNGFEVEILPVLVPLFIEEDESPAYYRQSLEKRIKMFSPDYIGYSFRNLYNFGPPPINTKALSDFFCISQDLHIINFLRNISDAPIIGGGSGFSLAPSFYMNFLNLDYGITGEGERPFVMLLNKLGMNHSTDDIPGLIRKTETITINYPVSLCSDSEIEEMDITSLTELKKTYYTNGGYGSIQTKRGCAFECSYCVYPYLEGKRYRLRQVEQIIEEIKDYLKNHEIRHIYFVDSVFSIPSDHALAICEKIIESKIDISWYAYVNPRDLDENLLKKFKKSGCSGLVLTIESGSDKILKRLKKGFSKEDSITSIYNLKKSGIPFEVSMLVGSPGETEETLDENLCFCNKYLNDVPVVFTPGVWMHPVSSVFSEYFGTEKNETDSLSSIILSNDFKRHNELHYFFSDLQNASDLINKLFIAVNKEPLWFILGKDIIPDYRSGVMRYPGNESLKRYSRPWFKDL